MNFKLVVVIITFCLFEETLQFPQYQGYRVPPNYQLYGQGNPNYPGFAQPPPFNYEFGQGHPNNIVNSPRYQFDPSRQYGASNQPGAEDTVQLYHHAGGPSWGGMKEEDSKDEFSKENLEKQLKKREEELKAESKKNKKSNPEFDSMSYEDKEKCLKSRFCYAQMG